MFVDSQETYWDGYAQAWRYIGFFTDCNPDQDDKRRHRRRRMNEDEEESCKRYLLWAAYVDLDYEGIGIGQYQYYNTYTEEWDTSACEAIGNENCTKMDCHLPDTTFQLMGYFKEEDPSEWFEQLFKHQSYCVWQEGEYNFMYGNYDSWPQGCAQTEYYLSDGTSLYYDMKPLANGTMSIGLFLDSRCSQDYMGDEITVEDILNNGSNDDFLSEYNIEYWNKAMEIHRICQPCRAYALYEGYGDGNNNRDRRRRLDDDPNNGLFQCDDAAGYTNVNQCMKFRTKTDMEYANFNEVWLAAQQGGITTLPVAGRVYGEYRSGYTKLDEEEDVNFLFFYISLGVFVLGTASLISAMRWRQSRQMSTNPSLKQPLVSSSGSPKTP